MKGNASLRKWCLCLRIKKIKSDRDTRTQGRPYLGREDFSLPCAEKNDEVRVGEQLKGGQRRGPFMVEVMESHLQDWESGWDRKLQIPSWVLCLRFPILSNQLPSFMNSLLFSFSPCGERLNSLTNSHAWTWKPAVSPFTCLQPLPTIWLGFMRDPDPEPHS